jgi:DNA-binding NarL/FixJ family response regulator
MPRVRLVLAGAEPLLLEAFRALLEPEFEVVAAVTGVRALLAECERLKPDVALADNQLRLLNPTSIDRRLKAVSPRTKLILLTAERQRLSQTFGNGGARAVSKTGGAGELKRAIRDAALTGPESEARTQPEDSASAQVPGLTVRQSEVLQLLASGHSMKEVASMLHVTARTIAFHKYRMMEELDVKTTAELVRFAVRNGVPER